MAASATEAAIQALRGLIIDGGLPPGSRLPAEPELATQFGLSMNTLREAVRALITARVLDVRRGDGTYVTSLEPHLLLQGIGFAVELIQGDQVMELLELRQILEPAAAGLAAMRMTESQLLELQDLLAGMTDTHGETRIMQDVKFHGAIAAASRNTTLATILGGISGQTVHARIWHGMLDRTADQRAHEDHAAIFAALQAGDSTLAHSAALVHVANTARWYRQMLDPATSSGGGDDSRP